MKERKRIPLALPLLLCALVFFGGSLHNLERGRHDEGRLQLEQALRRCAAACYASEGFYPPNVAYMQAHYGLSYDTGEYDVRYEIFASNLMPDITVLDR